MRDARLTTDDICLGGKGVHIPTRELFVACRTCILAGIAGIRGWHVARVEARARTHSDRLCGGGGVFIVGLEG